MKLPKHIFLNIEHNEHKLFGMTVTEWAAWQSSRAEEMTDLEDMEDMKRSNEMWSVTWYPETPVESHTVYASTLEKALAAANSGEP